MKIRDTQKTWFSTLVMGVLLVLFLWRDYRENPINLGYYLLGISILISIAGITMSFSKKERERTRKQVLEDLPERASLINDASADKKTKRRGYILLAVGIVLFIVWLNIYGFASLSTI